MAREEQLEMHSIYTSEENKVSEEDKVLLLHADDALNHLKLSRKRSMIVLKEIASQFEELFKKDKAVELSGCVTGLTGGALGIAGGAISIATAGAAIPFLVGGLLTAGTVSAVAGGAAKIGNKITTQQKEAELLQKLERILKEDIVLHDFLRNALEAIKGAKSLQTASMSIKLSDPDLKDRSKGICCVQGALQLAEKILHHFIPLKDMLTLDGAIKTFIETIVVVASDSIVKATAAATDSIAMAAANAVETGAVTALKTSSEMGARTGIKAGLETAFKTVQETIESATKKGATILVKATPDAVAFESKELSQQVAYKAFAKVGDETAVESSKILAQTTAKEVAKTAAVVTGGVTIFFGIVSVGLETFQIIRQCQKSKSTIGSELRMLAACMEAELT